MVTKLTSIIEATPPYQSHCDSTQSASIADHTTRALVGSAINVAGTAGRVYTLTGIEIAIKSTATTTVNAGGLVEITNDAIDWAPTEIYSNINQHLGATTGCPQTPLFVPLNKPLPAGSNISVYYTAFNAATDRCQVTLFWTTKPYSGQQTFVHSGLGTALTQVTEAAANLTLTIPANKGGYLVGYLVQIFGALETVVVSGGLVRVHNQSSNPALEPFRFVTGGLTCIVSGGAELPVLKIPAYADCQGNSNFVFDFMPNDNQSQQLAVGIVWES